jgi:hypothetical protein
MDRLDKVEEILARLAENTERSSKESRADMKRFEAQNERFRADTEKFRKENAEFRKENAEFRADTERFRKENEEFRAENKKARSIYSGTTHNLGREVEIEVNSFFDRELKNNKKIKIGDILFDDFISNYVVPNKLEIDNILVNGKYVAIAEVKRNLTDDDIDHFFRHTLKSFKENLIINENKKFFPFKNRLFFVEDKELVAIFIGKNISIKKTIQNKTKTFILREDKNKEFHLVK